MEIDQIIKNLEMFDDNICCDEGCPVFQIGLQACSKDGEEVCLCFHEAIKILRQLR